MEKEFDLQKRTYRYALDIMRFIDTLEKTDYSIQVIVKQLIRCATSVGANVVEAQAGHSRRDFVLFYTHALKSANECKFWLGLLCDSGKCDAVSAGRLLNETAELANILAACIITLKGKRKS